MERVVIVGGGVAGLSCLNALLDNQVFPLLLDASAIGSPKMCGEFLAPKIIARLKQWGIGPLQPIKRAHFYGSSRRMTLAFAREAGAYSRHDAEMQLAARARRLGGRIMEGASIQTITPATHNTPYLLQMTSGDTIQAEDVIFAAPFSRLREKGPEGRMRTSSGGNQAHSSIYMGFKTHVAQVIQPETLLMYSLKDGYLGMVPVSKEISNITCLVKREAVEKAGSCTAFFTRLLQDDPRFKESGLSFTLPALDWLEGGAPAFGVKTIPNWPHAYWIGDALLSIHPAVGHGFAHAVSSACMAAEHYLHRDAVGYHQSIQRKLRPKRILGQCMHQLLQKPRLCNMLSPMLGANAWMVDPVLKLLDD